MQIEVLNDIFGKHIGSTLLTGLVDSNSMEAYEEKLDISWKNGHLMMMQTSIHLQNFAAGLMSTERE